MSDTRDVDIFSQALPLTGSAREDYLREACAGDEELRHRVEKLLGSFARAGDFLASPVNVESNTAGSVAETAGSWVGRYKLLQQIGEGGCGVVFMAEQQEPVRRQVALKVIKPGMDTKSVIARFEAERQAVALMDHPNIARVIDAGATASGRPYFVMELVRGLPITLYCDQNALSTVQRLNLFIQVCSAVQHAHQKGIVHRDLKPSNVLVTTSTDGKPVPKVIDFGIAKATTGQRLTDKTLFTAFEMLIGTPAYMSPEQADLTSVDIDTRSDIYSLGALLYELLTGTPPFETQTLLKAGIDEMRRVIRSEDPVRPSTRLTTMVQSDLSDISRRRHAEPARLIRDLRGDLDWIVMKALEKERSRRYPTANGLAMDVERYLTGEMVWARPPSPFYRLCKLISRNKTLFGCLAIILFLLSAGLAVTFKLLLVDRKIMDTAKTEKNVSDLERTAVMQAYGGKVTESESNFIRAFNIRREALNNEPPNALVYLAFLQLLRKESKSLEAEPYLAAFVSPLDHSSSDYLDQIRYFAESLAGEGRWSNAVPYALELVHQSPDNPNEYHILAPILVAAHDWPAYQDICKQLTTRFGNTQDPYVADRMAKDSLIRASTNIDFHIPDRMIDMALAKGTGSGSYHMFQCCKALAQYRLGNYENAQHWAELALANPHPYSKAEANAILSMSLQKMGKPSEANIALAECRSTIEEKLPKLQSRNLGADWRDWIFAHQLAEEAAGLIGQNPHE